MKVIALALVSLVGFSRTCCDATAWWRKITVVWTREILTTNNANWTIGFITKVGAAMNQVKPNGLLSVTAKTVNGYRLHLANEGSVIGDDCEGMKCGGGFYKVGGSCVTPGTDGWPFPDWRWTPEEHCRDPGANGNSPTQRCGDDLNPPFP